MIQWIQLSSERYVEPLLEGQVPALDWVKSFQLWVPCDSIVAAIVERSINKPLYTKKTATIYTRLWQLAILPVRLFQVVDNCQLVVIKHGLVPVN